MRRSILLIVSLLIPLILLCSCKTIEEDDAKALVSEYLGELEAKNYDAVEDLSDFVSTKNIETALIQLETKSALDFESEIEIVSYTGFESTHSNSYYGVPTCNITVMVDIGEDIAEIEFMILDNDGVYKVCRIYLTIGEETYEIA